jgi:RNA polymerase sigma factor (sigma-70 family)
MGLTMRDGTARASSGREARRQVAFEEFILPEAGRLYRLALAIVDDPGEAEDAVQETMLTAWRKWSSIEDYEKPSAWLTRVCVNQCIRRRRLLRRWLVVSHDQWAEASPQRPDLEGRLLDLHRGYQRLSPSQRAMVTLHLRDGLTVNECAAILGCRPGTARSHLGRAMNKLRAEVSRA